jgi:DNA polymerase-3 subunit alpha
MDDDNHNFTANGIVSHNSHSVGYAKTAYVTAFLKANWPAEFAAALLSVTSGDDKRLAVLRSLRAEGILVLGPDVNVSGTKTSVDDTGAVRLGLGEIKGVGLTAEAVVAERDTSGPFDGLADLLGRVTVNDPKTGQAKKVPVNIVEAMIEAGALDAVGVRLGQSMALKALRDAPGVAVCNSEWGAVERATRERLRLGVLVSPSPLQSLNGKLDGLKHAGSHSSQTVAIHRIRSPGGHIYTIGVGPLRGGQAGTRRAYLTLEGSHGSIDCLMWADALDRTEVNGRLPAVGDVVGVEGKVKQTITGHVHDEDTDGTVPNTEPSLELLINQVWFADIDDSPSVTDGRSIAWSALTGVTPAPTFSVPAPAAIPADRAKMNAPAAA